MDVEFYYGIIMGVKYGTKGVFFTNSMSGNFGMKSSQLVIEKELLKN